MAVTYDATNRKNEIFNLLPGAIRIGKGQRWVIKLADGKMVMLKTSLADSIMVKTDVKSPEDAVISGFADDVDHVLLATGQVGELKAYLIPRDVLERTFRAHQRKWMDDTKHEGNTTWVINDVSRHFAQYSYQLEGKAAEASDGKLSPEEAKIGLARFFNTTPDKINISVTY